MEILKKFSKYILVTMVALCGLIFVSRPVYAATINLDNSSNRYFSVIGDYPSGYHYVYAYYLNSSVKSSLKPIALTYGSRSFYLVLTKASQGTMAVYRFQNGLVAPDGTVDSVCTGSVDVSDIDISSSFISLYDYLGGTSVDGTNSGISFRNYLISKGFSDSDQKKYLSDYKVFSVYSESSPTAYRSSGCTVGLNGLLEVTAEQLFQQVKSAVDTGDDSGLFDQKDDSESGSDDDLPMLDYDLKKKYATQWANDFITTNICVKWDHTKTAPYSEDLNRYKVEVRAVTQLSDLTNSDKYKTITVENTSSDYLSFGAEAAAELLGFYGDNLKGTKGYLYSVAIRTLDTESNSVSNWKTWTIGASGHGRNPTVTPGTNNYDKDGNIVTKDPTKEHDTVDNSRLERDPDGTATTASKDKNSDMYADADGKVSTTGTLSSLKQIIVSLGDVPKLLALCLTWLPDSFSVLITASLSMIVIIGVVRWLK